ncbi:MAG: hypothetical protein ACLS23_17230 [Clostridioides difficile]|nr:hypothetical protein [Intestinibacter bartlettii]
MKMITIKMPKWISNIILKFMKKVNKILNKFNYRKIKIVTFAIK